MYEMPTIRRVGSQSNFRAADNSEQTGSQDGSGFRNSGLTVVLMLGSFVMSAIGWYKTEHQDCLRWSVSPDQERLGTSFGENWDKISDVGRSALGGHNEDDPIGYSLFAHARSSGIGYLPIPLSLGLRQPYTQIGSDSSGITWAWSASWDSSTLIVPPSCSVLSRPVQWTDVTTFPNYTVT